MVESIDIKGSDEEEEADVEAVSESIGKILVRQDGYYKKRAERLKGAIREKGYTWKKTAMDFLDGVGIIYQEGADDIIVPPAEIVQTDESQSIALPNEETSEY